MSEETFPVALGGPAMGAAASALPRDQGDPAGAVPGLRRGRRRGDLDATASRALGEAQIERLAEATWRAIAHVDPALQLRGRSSTCRSRSAN